MTSLSPKIPLFVARFSVFYFLSVWALDRIIDAEHASKVASKYYKIGPVDFGAIPQPVVGVALLVLYVAFLIGFKKKFTYAAVFAIQLIGLIMIIPHIIPFIEGYKLGFVTALPACAATFLLYVMKDEDTLLSINN